MSKCEQGISPFLMRGKIINSFKASKAEQGATQIIFGQDHKKILTIDDCNTSDSEEGNNNK